MFNFKKFSIDDSGCAMKVGTDSVLLGSWSDIDGVVRVIDLGSGSGLLSLMMAQRIPRANVTAVELDPRACRCARANIEAASWAPRVNVVCADVMALPPEIAESAPDLIICNPPYFSGGLSSPDPRRSRARTSDRGFGPNEAIMIASEILSPGGSLAMVTPADMAADIVFEAEMRRMQIWRRCDVVAVAGRAPGRTLWQIARKETHRTPERMTLTIRRDGELTEEYARLTSEFYL